MSRRTGFADEMFTVLAQKFSGDAYVVLPQVANATGFAAGRWLDCVVASLWPSRGLWLHGFEIKIDRHDWLRELRQGAKADTHCQQLDFFSVAVSHSEIVEPGELPEPWGLVVVDVKKGKVKTLKEPARLRPADQPLDRPFVMALLRQFDKQVVSGEINRQMQARYDDGLKHGEDRARYAFSRSQETVTRNAAFLDEFTKTIDDSYLQWRVTPENGAKLGRLLKSFYAAEQSSSGFLGQRQRLLDAAEVLAILAGEARHMLIRLEALELAALAPEADTDTRYDLCSIQVRANGDTVVTNGHAFLRIKAAAIEPTLFDTLLSKPESGWEEDVVVNAEDATGFKKACRRAAKRAKGSGLPVHVAVARCGDAVSLATADGVTIRRFEMQERHKDDTQPEPQYPNVDRVIPLGEKRELTLSVDLLFEILRVLRRLKVGNVTLGISEADMSPIVLTATAKSGAIDGAIMPMKVD